MSNLVDDYVLSLIWGGAWPVEDKRRIQVLYGDAETASRPQVSVRIRYGYEMDLSSAHRFNFTDESHEAEGGRDGEVGQLTLAVLAQQVHLASQAQEPHHRTFQLT